MTTFVFISCSHLLAPVSKIARTMETYMRDGDSIIKLPADLPTLITRDGKVCYLDCNTVWIPTGARPEATANRSQRHELAHQHPNDMSDQSSNMSQSPYQMQYSNHVDMGSASSRGSGDMSSMMTIGSDLSWRSSFEQSNQEPDLTEINPEYFTCGLPGLDEPLSTSTPVHMAPIMGWAGNSASFPLDDSPCVKTASGPRVHQRHHSRTSVPENRPLFEPQPLGERHAPEKRCVRRLFAASPEDEDSTFWSMGLASLSSLADSTLEESRATSSQSYCLINGRAGSSKRKLPSDDSKVMRGGKLAKVNANDVITEMELLRAVESLSHVRWDTPGA